MMHDACLGGPVFMAMAALSQANRLDKRLAALSCKHFRKAEIEISNPRRPMPISVMDSWVLAE
jgi:hypothetical protein